MPEFILMKWFLENSLVTKGWKLVARGTNHVTKRVRTFNPSLWPLRKREEVEFESITNGQWFNQSCFSIESSIKKTNKQTNKKNPEEQGLEHFLVASICRCWEAAAGEQRSLCPSCLPATHKHRSTVWCFWVISFYHKLVSELFSWVLCAALAKYLNRWWWQLLIL